MESVRRVQNINPHYSTMPLLQEAITLALRLDVTQYFCDITV